MVGRGRTMVGKSQKTVVFEWLKKPEFSEWW
jgi:hypothetical protein